MITKSIEENFADWESDIFGFGYGSGEEHTLGALKTFLLAIPMVGNYDYQHLENTVTPTVAWLLLNTLCHADIIEYGTSPRFGWLTEEGKALQAFVGERTLEELLAIIQRDEVYNFCSPTTCNCGPNGFVEGANCQNPFWPNRHNP